MQQYRGYIEQYHQAEASLQKHEKKARFVALMKECKALPSNRRNLALQAYLIMPLYRIARSSFPRPPPISPPTLTTS